MEFLGERHANDAPPKMKCGRKPEKWSRDCSTLNRENFLSLSNKAFGAMQEEHTLNAGKGLCTTGNWDDKRIDLATRYQFGNFWSKFLSFGFSNGLWYMHERIVTQNGMVLFFIGPSWNVMGSFQH